MAEGFPVGLASLIIQAQVFFTILLARIVLSERPRRAQILVPAIGFAGMATIGSERLAGADLGPFLWSFWRRRSGPGETSGEAARQDRHVGFTFWSSLAAPLPLFLLSLAFEGEAGLAGLRIRAGS